MEYRGHYINDARLHNQIKEEEVIDYFPGDGNEFELGEDEESKKSQERITEANKQQLLREAIKLIEQNGGTVNFKRK